MKNLSIIFKFLSIMGLFGLFAIGTCFYSTGQMRHIDDAYSALESGDNIATLKVSRAARQFAQARAAIADIEIAPTPAANQASVNDFTASAAKFTTYLDDAATAAPAHAQEFASLKSEGLDVLNNQCADAVKLGMAANDDAGDIAAQKVYLSDCQPKFGPVLTDLSDETDKLVKETSVQNDGLTGLTDNTITTTYGLIIGGLVLVLTLGFFGIRAWVITPIKALMNTMGKLSGGDYKTKVDGQDRKDEIGGMSRAVQVFKDAGLEKIRLEAEAETQRAQAAEERGRVEAERARAAAQVETVVAALADGLERLSSGDLLYRLNASFSAEYEKLRADFNAAMEKLQETMKSIAANTAGVRNGASEINQASDDLSRRTEQQAASLEETAAALDQITATVKRSAESAKEARELVTTAKTDAERSGEVVREMVGAMSGIETSSKQIGNIISVIDEIAFQTNLLALNAGVEAARAGDAGRGFAVVATEVRALAQRSAEAAKEIKALISASGQQVDSGVKLVAETGKALVRIVEQVSKLNQVVGTIAASAQEQATGLNEVNTAVNQMDQVTQRNAAMVEESTAASHALANEAAELSQLVGQFQIGAAADTRHSQVARRPAPAVKTPAPRGRAERGGADRVVAFNRGTAAAAEAFEDASEF
jgi:methyl-accepting chemotaxis protein